MRFHGQRGGRTRRIPGVSLFIGMREIKDDRVGKEKNEKNEIKIEVRIQ